MVCSPLVLEEVTPPLILSHDPRWVYVEIISQHYCGGPAFDRSLHMLGM